MFGEMALVGLGQVGEMVSLAGAGGLLLGGVATSIALLEIRKTRQMQARLTDVRETDPLTGLPHRAVVRSRLETALERARALGESLAVLHLDIDNFKDVNDSYGHVAGDALLQAAARRLQALSGAPSFAGRLAGDEFVIVFDRTTAADAAPICERIQQAVRAFDWARLGTMSGIGISIGLAQSRPGDTPDALIERADVAMYDAKRAG